MRRALTAIVGFVSLLHAQGQNSLGNRIGLGVYQQRVEADGTLPLGFREGLTTLTAPTITLPLEIGVSDHLSAVIELGHVQRGSRTVSSGYTSTERVNSLELAFLVKGRMEFGRWMPYALAGPSITRPLSVQFKSSTATSQGSFNEEWTNAADDLSTYERSYVSLYAGAGMSFSIGAPRLFLDYRAMWGMTPVQRGNLTDVNGNVLREIGIFDQGHVISLGWSIPLSREAWRATSPAKEAPIADPQK